MEVKVEGRRVRTRGLRVEREREWILRRSLGGRLGDSVKLRSDISMLGRRFYIVFIG